MVTKHALLATLLLTFPLATFAQSFTAHVNRPTVGLGDSFDLRLELENVAPDGSPDLSELEKNFQIVGQQQSSVMNMINGKSSSSTVWDLTLIPTHMGSQEIPSIALHLNSGDVKTNPIPMEVMSEPVAIGARTAQAPGPGIALTGHVSNTSPYKYERTQLTYEMAVARPLRNVEVGNLEIKDAIVDRQGDPKIQTRLINGRSKQVLVVSYLVTPLKDGTLTIPPLVVRAETPDLRRRSALASQSDIFGDDADGPFAQMHKLMQNFMREDDVFDGFAPMRPIAISSSPIHLKVLSPIQGMSPWLPTSSLKLTESWSGDAKVGEPITRVITARAADLAPSQLPGFEEILNSNQDYKIYADQPALSEKSFHGTVISSKKNTLTIIPQREGDIRFPAIQVAWWDTVGHTQRVSTLPEKTVHVLPGALPLAASPTDGYKIQNQSASKTTNGPQSTTFATARWIDASLLAVVLGLLAYLIHLFIRPQRAQPSHVSPLEQKAKPIVGRREINRCNTAHELQQFLQRYSESRWGVLPNASLARIFSTAESRLAEFDKPKAREILERLEGDLYAQTPVDAVKLRQEVADLFFAADRQLNEPSAKTRFPELNPT